GGSLADARFRAMVYQDLETGQHRNPAPDERPEWFTNAYFHTPDELRAEVLAAGLEVEALLAIEGPGWLLANDPAARRFAIEVARAVEAEPSVLGVGSHVMAIARRPAGRPS